jgi:hypothetical protein
MGEALDAFLSGRLPLGRLISIIEGLLDALEGPDPEWLDRAQEQWSRLETTYAVALDRGDAALPLESTAEVTEAVEALRALVASA